MKKQSKKVVDRRYARTKHYAGVLQDIESQKVCPFCLKTFKWHTKPILLRHKGWLITESFQPYPNTNHHLLVISEKHKEKFESITARDWSALSFLVKWAIRKYRIRGGGVTMRFGDTLCTGATVYHLHFHLIVPQITNGKAKPVYFPIG